MANKLEQERRERFLRNLISESVVNSLVEMDHMRQEEQNMSSVPPNTPGPAPETNKLDPDLNKQFNEPTIFDVDEMVDKLNVLRGSRSFTDPEVYGRLNTFFNNLTQEQKNSIDWLLTELGKIVIDASEQQVEPNSQQTVSPNQTPPAPQQNIQQPTAPAQSAPVTPVGV
jgi:hypothetical protein